MRSSHLDYLVINVLHCVVMNRIKRENAGPSTHRWAWWWFGSILFLGTLFGAALAIFLFMPLAMATDGCYESSTEWVCGLSSNGQNMLILTPWVSLVAGLATSFIGAIISSRHKRTPLIGLAVGVLAYFAIIPFTTIVADWL